MTEAYGFKDRSTAQRLRDFAGQLDDRPQPGMKGAPRPSGIGQHRAYWIVPKGTIPAAADETTPGVGKAYICKLNRTLATPTIERHQHGGQDVEVDVFNYTASAITEEDELKPLHRVYEDVFGELAIVEATGSSTSIGIAQAVNLTGINPRTGVTAGVTVNGGRPLVLNPSGLYTTTPLFDVYSWKSEAKADTGDRLFSYVVIDGLHWLLDDDCVDVGLQTITATEPT